MSRFCAFEHPEKSLWKGPMPEVIEKMRSVHDVCFKFTRIQPHAELPPHLFVEAFNTYNAREQFVAGFFDGVTGDEAFEVGMRMCYAPWHPVFIELKLTALATVSTLPDPRGSVENDLPVLPADIMAAAASHLLRPVPISA